jgi:hypothetical protein
MTDESQSERAGSPWQTDAAEANLNRLLSRMHSADEPDPDFVRRVQGRLVREARQLAAERRSRAASVPIARRRRIVWAVAACSLAGVVIAATALRLGVHVGHNERPAITADHPGREADPVGTAPEVTGAAANREVTEPMAAGSPAVVPVAETDGPRVFSVVGPEGAVCVSYDDIAADLPGESADLPPSLRTLAGRRIRIRGFMVPAFEESGLRWFVLSRDNEACCFGPNPRPCDVIPVTLREGVTTDYIQGRPFDVVGTFRVQPESAPDGKIERLYALHDALVVGR